MARVLFLQKTWTENLGPMYLSAHVKRHGHTTELLIENNRNFNAEIKSCKPDLIAFSITTGMHQWAINRATELKEFLDCPIIFGGPHATYYPEVVKFPAVDLICRGEGEAAFLEVLNRIDSGRDFLDIPSIWIKTGDGIRKQELGELLENLDDLAAPDRGLYYKYSFLRNNENKPFVSGRGCPFSCTYCSIAGLRELYKGKGKFVRFHSPEHVIAEISEVKAKYGLRSVIFQDDTFIIGEERLGQLLELYQREIRLPYVCHIRADLLTLSIADQLKKSGCHSVDFGLESGDETIRATVLGKQIKDDQLRQAAVYLKTAGIRFRTTNMFGLPGETLDQAYQTIRLNQEIGTDYPSASLYQPYPRTTLGDQVIREKRVTDGYSVDAIGSTFFRNSLLKSPHRNQFINIQKLFWPAIKFPRLLPGIKKLVNFRPNPLYELIFLFFYAVNYALSEKVSVKRVLSLGIHNARTVFFGRFN